MFLDINETKSTIKNISDNISEEIIDKYQTPMPSSIDVVVCFDYAKYSSKADLNFEFSEALDPKDKEALSKAISSVFYTSISKAIHSMIKKIDYCGEEYQDDMLDTEQDICLCFERFSIGSVDFSRYYEDALYEIQLLGMLYSDLEYPLDSMYQIEECFNSLSKEDSGYLK